jgi:hypothetical protein
MVEFPSNFLDLNAIYGLASSQSYTYWIGIGVNILLSTIIGGIILIVILEIFSKAFKEPVKPANAFIAVLVVNLINMIGIMGLLLPYIIGVPYLAVILPLLIWIGMIKAFFGELSILHALIIGVIFFLITLFALPMLTGMVMVYIPSFG